MAFYISCTVPGKLGTWLSVQHRLRSLNDECASTLGRSRYLRCLPDFLFLLDSHALCSAIKQTVLEGGEGGGCGFAMHTEALLQVEKKHAIFHWYIAYVFSKSIFL